MIVLSNVSTGCSKDEPPVPDPEPPTPVLPTSPEWIDTKFAYVLQVCGYIPDAATVTKEEVVAIDTLIIPLWDSLEPYPDRYLTSLKGIEFFKGLECLKCGINRIEELDLTSNTNLKYLDCDFNHLTTLNLSGLTELQIVICDWNEGLENLNLTDCRKLKTLNAWQNRLTILDLSTNLALETVDCRGGYLQELKLPEGSQLRKIVAGSFGGESLYVPSSPHLAHLDCGGHNLRHLTVDDPSTITHLDISYSKLDVEILQEFPNLTELHCIDMDWSQLDLSFNTRLESLHCYNSHLSNLDLSNNPLLDYADIHGNNLTQLDLSNNPLLYYADIHNNDLIQLDLSNNPILHYADIHNNDLTQLDISNLKQLTWLNVRQNRLQALDVRGLPWLETLLIQENPGKDNIFQLILGTDQEITIRPDSWVCGSGYVTTQWIRK